MKLHKGQAGFTLIELLIVIAILGVLIAIAVPNLISFLGMADVTAANAEARVVRTAMVAYIAANNGDVPSGSYSREDMGVLDKYIDNDLVGSYTITVGGEVVGIGGWKNLEWTEDGRWQKIGG